MASMIIEVKATWRELVLYVGSVAHGQGYAFAEGTLAPPLKRDDYAAAAPRNIGLGEPASDLFPGMYQEVATVHVQQIDTHTFRINVSAATWTSKEDGLVKALAEWNKAKPLAVQSDSAAAPVDPEYVIVCWVQHFAAATTVTKAREQLGFQAKSSYETMRKRVATASPNVSFTNSPYAFPKPSDDELRKAIDTYNAKNSKAQLLYPPHLRT